MSCSAANTYHNVTSQSLTDCGEPLVEGMDQPAIDDLRRLPAGYHWYETMLILNPEMDDLARDKELAKFEAYINKEQCINIQAVLRSRTRLAYPMQKHVDGIYILYTFAARKQTARVIQRFLSNPESGSEGNLLRHITFRKS
ncbi:hypothetical protein QJQ45_004250 [Haematococcus lacustris]|nr:hypothetical protein QJQ45_004250 [Haematococcus lacustris]